MLVGVFLLRANSFVVLDSAFAGVKCAIGLHEHGLRLVGNVKTCHSAYPREVFKNTVLKRGDLGAYTTELPNKHGEMVSLTAVGDMDKKPMFLISTSGTTLPGPTQQRRRHTRFANGDYEIKNFELKQSHIHSHYRGNFNMIDKHNQARQGTHGCIEDANRTQGWPKRDFFGIFATAVVNAQFAWNLWGPPSTTPDAKPVSTLVFQKMLTKVLLNNPTRKAEVAYAASAQSLRSRQPRWNMREEVEDVNSAPNLCVFDALDRKLYNQGYCKYCGDKTNVLCLTCTPAGAVSAQQMAKTVNRQGQRRKRGPASLVFFVCSSGSRHQCVLRHSRGEVSQYKEKAKALDTRW